MHYLSPVYINNRVFDAFKLKILIQPIDGTEIKEEFVELIKKFYIFKVLSISCYLNTQLF